MSDMFGIEYGGYIIPAFVVSGLVFAWLIADTLLRARKWKREAERLQAEKDAKKAAK